MKILTSARLEILREELYIAHFFLFFLCKLAFRDFLEDEARCVIGVKKEIIPKLCLTSQA